MRTGVKLSHDDFEEELFNDNDDAEGEERIEFDIESLVKLLLTSI